MKTVITLCLCAISFLASELAMAAIYKHAEPNGQVVYSNVMKEGFIKLKLGWEKLENSDSDNINTVYFDSDTIRKNNDRVKMWDLIDYKTSQENSSGKPVFSRKVQREYGCKEEQVRLLAFSSHSGNMGAGNVVFSSSNPSKWEPVPPESIAQALWNIACGVKQ